MDHGMVHGDTSKSPTDLAVRLVGWSDSQSKRSWPPKTPERGKYFYTNLVSMALNHSTNARKLDLVLSSLFINWVRIPECR